MKLFFLLLVLILKFGIAYSAETPAKLIPVRDSCQNNDCSERHAIIFVHGIYGNSKTFTNEEVDPKFNWPEHVPTAISEEFIDVFRIDYQSQLITWVVENNSSLDQIIDSIYPEIAKLRSRKYKSINFVAHSLGGNVVQAYLLSVKTKEGHKAFAEHGFVVTVGTPVNGASIANVGILLKSIFGMSDPLLESLTKNNTFVKMMRNWANNTSIKADTFGCRPIHLFAGVESKPLGPILVVDSKSALTDLPENVQSRIFPLNHSQIAKPSSEEDEVFTWFKSISEAEIKRIKSWEKAHNGNLCAREL